MKKCDRCEREATVHDLKLLKGGVVSEVHLCEKCAAELGIAGQNFASVDELLQQAIAQQAGILSVNVQVSAGATPDPVKTPPKPGVCPNCSTTWSEFVDRGLFGCPECYTTFEDKIGPLLERAHEGGTHHVGKFPQRGQYQQDEEVQARYLHKQLEDAVASEQFERAAQIRDQICALAEVTKHQAPDQPHDMKNPPTPNPEASHEMTDQPGREGGNT